MTEAQDVKVAWSAALPEFLGAGHSEGFTLTRSEAMEAAATLTSPGWAIIEKLMHAVRNGGTEGVMKNATISHLEPFLRQQSVWLFLDQLEEHKNSLLEFAEREKANRQKE